MLNIEAMVVITARDSSEKLIGICKKNELPITLAALGTGTATREVLDTLGLDDSKKTVILTIALKEKIHIVEKEIKRDLGIGTPGTSIVFTIPVSSIAGTSAAVQILEHKPIERMDWDMSNTFELVIAIANEGYSKQVMDAARAKGGATGGTVIHARGLGGEEERKFFGISISEEKEIVLIVCRTHCKSKIMQAIAEDAGQNTKAKSFTFSVPVSSVEGLWIKRDDE